MKKSLILNFQIDLALSLGYPRIFVCTCWWIFGDDFVVSKSLILGGGIIDVYNEHRTKLILEHCKKDENGNPLIEDDCYLFEDVAGWNKAIMELNLTEVEVDLTTVPVEVLEKCDEGSFDSLSVNEVNAMGFMICE